MMYLGAPEKKTLFETVSANLGAAVLNATTLYEVGRGTEMGQRIGKHVNASNIFVKFYIRNLQTAKGVYVRAIIVQDKKPQLTGLGTHMFQTQTSSNTPVDYNTTASTNNIQNVMNRERWIVKSDRKWLLSAATTQNPHHVKMGQYNVKINKKFV